MASLNKVILYGRLGKDPDLRTTKSGEDVASLSVATHDVWKDKAGQKQEKTEWHNVVVWGQLATNCGKYLAKGREVLLEGALATRSYDDKEGVKRYVTEIKANSVKFVGAGSDKSYQKMASDIIARKSVSRVDDHEFHDIPF